MTEYRILITGSRHWGDAAAVNKALLDATNGMDRARVTVVHGNAQGADRHAGNAAEFYGMNVEVHPADWNKHGKAAGPIRNQKMVDLGADICLAFPHPTFKSVGTRHCMKAAEKAGIPVKVIEGDV